MSHRPSTPDDANTPNPRQQHKEEAARLNVWLHCAGYRKLGNRRALDTVSATYGTDWNTLSARPDLPRLALPQAAAALQARAAGYGVNLSLDAACVGLESGFSLSNLVPAGKTTMLRGAVIRDDHGLETVTVEALISQGEQPHKRPVRVHPLEWAAPLPSTERRALAGIELTADVTFTLAAYQAGELTTDRLSEGELDALTALYVDSLFAMRLDTREDLFRPVAGVFPTIERMLTGFRERGGDPRHSLDRFMVAVFGAARKRKGLKELCAVHFTAQWTSPPLAGREQPVLSGRGVLGGFWAYGNTPDQARAQAYIHLLYELRATIDLAVTIEMETQCRTLAWDEAPTDRPITRRRLLWEGVRRGLPAAQTQFICGQAGSGKTEYLYAHAEAQKAALILGNAADVHHRQPYGFVDVDGSAPQGRATKERLVLNFNVYGNAALTDNAPQISRALNDPRPLYLDSQATRLISSSPELTAQFQGRVERGSVTLCVDQTNLRHRRDAERPSEILSAAISAPMSDLHLELPLI